MKTKKTELSTKERNRKAAAILRTIDAKDLTKASGGVVLGPEPSGFCFTCGIGNSTGDVKI
jgi:hypothetical protein